jgi:hypothetical protein
VLLNADRIGINEIRLWSGLGKLSVWRWQKHHIDLGVHGLLRDKARPSRIPKLVDATVAEVIRLTRKEASPDGDTH